jgi:uncharacterized protein
MASRRTSGGRKPPPRAESLKPEYVAAVEALGAKGPLIIGGKSMGGRVASMVADELYVRRRDRRASMPRLSVSSPGAAATIAHQTPCRSGVTPTLICQGTRDEFGTREEVAGYDLSERIELLWLEDGDHDLKPRKSVSGFTAADHLRTMAEAVSTWFDRIRR